MTRSLLALALLLSACHGTTPPPATPADAPTVVAQEPEPAPTTSDEPAVRATGETTRCGLTEFETARGTRFAMPGVPRADTERLGAFTFLSHVFQLPDITYALDEFTLPTDTGDGRAILEPLANGQVAAQAEWQVVSSEQRTLAGGPALVRVYRLEDGTVRRETYVARHRLAVRLVSEAMPPMSEAHDAAVRCFEASLALPADVR